jgi:hypothetical protein
LRSILLFLGLTAGTVESVLFWIFVGWMRLHIADPQGARVQDEFGLVCNFLFAMALIGAVIGKGRGRVWLLTATLVAYPIAWFAAHVGGGSVADFRPPNSPAPLAERVIALARQAINA